MAISEISARLRALATDDKRRPETARLRDIFDDIEIALNARVPQADVLAELHSLGYSMTLSGFKTAIQRIRKERINNQQGSISPATTLSEKNAQQALQPLSEEAMHKETSPIDDDLSGLDAKQRREQLATRFIKPENSNPLLKRIKKQNK